MVADYLKGHLENGAGASGEEAGEERTTNGKYYAGTYTSAQNTGYSTVTVEMEFSEDAIIGCKVSSSGDQDLMTADLRDAMAAAIVDGQSADVDAVSSSTLSFSVKAVQDAVADCIAQATA